MSQGRAAFQAHCGLSDAQMAPFDVYAHMLEKWQTRINLVGPKTLPDLWTRHFLDSAQLVTLWRSHLPIMPDNIADLGSGAGFPGLVIALLTNARVHIIDSDQRKISFLRQVALKTDITPVFHVKRIEAMLPLNVACITARACAPLEKLVSWADKLVGSDTDFWFLKGREAEEELTALKKSWTLEVQRYPSVTDPQAAVLCLRRCRPIVSVLDQ